MRLLVHVMDGPALDSIYVEDNGYLIGYWYLCFHSKFSPLKYGKYPVYNYLNTLRYLQIKDLLQIEPSKIKLDTDDLEKLKFFLRKHLTQAI